jgi:hypothetical protein
MVIFENRKQLPNSKRTSQPRERYSRQIAGLLVWLVNGVLQRLDSTIVTGTAQSIGCKGSNRLIAVVEQPNQKRRRPTAVIRA